MKRRDFAIGLSLAAAVLTVQAQEPAKQRRIAIVRPAGPVSLISDTGIHFYQAFFAELRQLGDIEDKTSRSSGIPARDGRRALPISVARSSTGTPT
jgi:hypothetical protein